MGMGRKLDSLLGKGFNTSKFKSTLNLAVSRLAVLKNQRQARSSIARSDVVEFLKHGNQERALLRVEQVIKEQNMVDVYVLLERYCQLLMERASLIEQEKICPDELVEAVSSLIHASSRCGDFPELQEIRKIFTSRFGKEFVAKAVELRNYCGVNPKMLQKLSTSMPNLENKTKVLEDIASDYNIVLQTVPVPVPVPFPVPFPVPVPVPVPVPLTMMEDQDSRKGNHQNPKISENTLIELEGLSAADSPKLREKYKNATHAAQVAFESAAYAATAARAAVELSRAESIGPR